MNRSSSLPVIRTISLMLIILILFSLTPPSTRADEVIFLDPPVKLYNDVVYDRFELIEPIILENTFEVANPTEIYLKLTSGGDTNMPLLDKGWSVRFVLKNSTWSFTDFGKYTTDTPTGIFELVPGEPYTLQTKVYYPVHDVRIGEVYEVMVTLVEQQSGSYHISHMLQHLVQFADEDILPPKIDFMLIGLIGFAVAIPSVIIVKYWRTNDNDKDKKSKRWRRKKKR